MHLKIEPSGCCERKGMVQVRFDFFLDPEDQGYEIVTLPIFPEEGYPGEVNEFGTPLDEQAFTEWVGSLPTVVQVNPFHTHFAYFDPATSKEDILAAGNKFMYEARTFKDRGEFPAVKNMPVALTRSIDFKRLSECEAKLAELKAGN